MKSIHLRPAEPEKDFGEIAVLISSQEDEPTTEAGLREDYEQNKGSIVRMMAAEDEQGELMGFYWAYRNKVETEWVSFTLVIKPERRGQGAGRRLYEDMLQAVKEAQAKRLRVSVREGCTEGRAFAERRGFNEIRHQIGMELDLEAFDDRPYDAILARLKGEGFRFTSMEELGNTEEAQRKLYALNDAASASTPGQGGEHAWNSFENFQKSVCQADWYKPDGEIVAIDTTSGVWAGMSAITRMQGRDYAYNLFTGVDMPYRGRKLGQAVKVLALRYARNVLKVKIVRTHHNTKNLPMIAIDTRFGYRLVSGACLMEKNLA
jgi:GNAT superfamily N-acetyltransferase/RimJ/RimL family protein N-acetyltransferase